MKTERSVRTALFLGSAAILLIVCAFLWLINANQSAALRQTHGEYLLILGGLALLCLGLFFAFAEVFDQAGKIASSLIVTMLVTLLLIMQIALAFSSFTSQNMAFSLGAFARARSIVGALDGADAGDYDGILRASISDELAFAAVIDTGDRALHASDPALIGDVLPVDGALSFPLYDGNRLLVRTDARRMRDVTLETLATQLTLLVTSLLFSVELVLFVIGRVSRLQGGGQSAQPAVLTNVRQIAFLFYFSTRLCASFIPLMARDLPASAAIDPNLIAALPQTCETALTCVTILLAGNLMRRRGWKPPFALGLGFVCMGTLGSAIAGTIPLFALARALVGLGYGFCWMTLRSLALFGEDDRARMWGFSMLNSGLYAGMFCGSTVGSILAVSIGRPAVLLVSAVLTALCGAYVLTMENRTLTPDARRDAVRGDAQARVTWRARVAFVAFLALMIAPTCIAVSYGSYFLPLFYADIGRSTLDVGRAQLLYGLIIVYLGPVLTARIVRARGSLALANLLYNGLIALAFILLGTFGGFGASIAAMALIGLGDGFGFGVQNSFYLAMPVNRRLSSERALTYMSLSKKLMEMLGPSVFALAMAGSARRGIFTLGVTFAACAALYLLLRIPLGTRAKRGA